MKKTTISYAAILLIGFASCSKSNSSPESSTTPSVSQGTPVKRITHTFPASESHEHNNFIFNYSNNRLTSGSSQMVYTSLNQIVSQGLQNFSLTYSSPTSISGTMWGSSFTGTLNSAGYLATLVFPTFTCTFSYTTDGQLSEIVETFSPNNRATIQFSYVSGNLVAAQVEEVTNNVTSNSAAMFQYGTTVNKSGVWPAAFDVGGISYFIPFYYAALLGKPTKNLALTATMTYPNESVSESFVYTYADGYVATCTRNSLSTLNGIPQTSSDLVTYTY